MSQDYQRKCFVDFLDLFVRTVRLELTRPCGRWNLNPVRLPIPPRSRDGYNDLIIKQLNGVQSAFRGACCGAQNGAYETQHGALLQGSLEADDGWRVVCRSLRSRAGYAALRSELPSPDSDVTVFDGQCRFQKTDCERHRRRVGYESRERQTSTTIRAISFQARQPLRYWRTRR